MSNPTTPREDETPLLLPPDEDEKLEDAMADALNLAFGDFASDTGCYPGCFQISITRKRPYLEVDFRRSAFAKYAIQFLLGKYPDLIRTALARSSPPAVSPSGAPEAVTAAEMAARKLHASSRKPYDAERAQFLRHMATLSDESGHNAIAAKLRECAGRMEEGI